MQLPLNSALTRKELREASDVVMSKPQQAAGQQTGVEWRPAGTNLQGQKVIVMFCTLRQTDALSTPFAAKKC